MAATAAGADTTPLPYLRTIHYYELDDDNYAATTTMQLMLSQGAHIPAIHVFSFGLFGDSIFPLKGENHASFFVVFVHHTTHELSLFLCKVPLHTVLDYSMIRGDLLRQVFFLH